MLTVIAFVPFLPQVADALVSGLDKVREELARAGVPPASSDALAQTTAQIKSSISATGGAIVGSIANAFSIAILSLFTTFFLLLDGDKAWAWAIGVAPAEKRGELTAAGRDALGRVGRYFRGAAIVASIDSLSDLVFLVLLGVPLAGPLAVLVFMLGFIPYFGPIIAAGVLVIATWAASGVTAVVALVGLIVAVKVVQARFLSPMTAGRNASIHPALVLVALPIGASLAGLPACSSSSRSWRCSWP